MILYTDGSTDHNGSATSTGGCGVYFGDDDPRNMGVAYEGPLPPTNQRCELWAIRLALQATTDAQDLTIYTDSKYAIGCLTLWCDAWKRNGWLNAKRQSVKNKEIIQSILELCDQRSVQFKHVKAHAGIHGNEEADRLANQGRDLFQRPNA